MPRAMIRASTKTTSEVITMDSINQTMSFRTKKYLNQSECFGNVLIMV